ncbi:hypothetical protein ACI77F_02920 [Pseudomonas tritici]|uniref:hypothetical protein n=1 Tax=Pseudomonas tritici TaxID=2745518 RepID=UPI00387A9427
MTKVYSFNQAVLRREIETLQKSLLLARCDVDALLRSGNGHIANPMMEQIAKLEGAIKDLRHIVQQLGRVE